MKNKQIVFDGKSTTRGASEEGFLFDPGGIEVKPFQTENSKSGRHWKHIWYVEKEKPYLLCVVANNGHGKDESYYSLEGEGIYTPQQLQILRDFRQQHPHLLHNPKENSDVKLAKAEAHAALTSWVDHKKTELAVKNEYQKDLDSINVQREMTKLEKAMFDFIIYQYGDCPQLGIIDDNLLGDCQGCTSYQEKGKKCWIEYFMKGIA